MAVFPKPPPWASELTTAGVTGTNGKTSTTLMLAGALGAATAPVAQTTTVGSFVGRERIDAPMDFGGFLATMKRARDAGGRHAVIELTSEALGMGFIRAWPCRVGVFTNLTRDHLDAHGSAEHYLASKAQLFMQLPAEGGAAVLNGCDPAAELLSEVIPPGVVVWRYGAPARGPAHAPLDLSLREVTLSWAGTRLALGPATERGMSLGVSSLEVRAIGEVFAENAMAALCAAVALGIDAARAARDIAATPPPPGRFEPLPEVAGQPRVVIDYAHTPDALSRTLASARRLCAGSLTVVFGAGGDRDQHKRPLMGEAAAAADRIVLTSDNPRSEDPAAIAAAIREGLPGHAGVSLELDRARAIRSAIADASEGDVVVIAGKGHETTQTIGGETRPFSDRDIARDAL